MKRFLSLINLSQFITIFTIILSVLPLSMILFKVFSGGIALWNDPARDLISALDSSTKPTLIGPSTGIPGVFYGPYWIWLLSFGQLFSKQPGLIAFIILTLPYLIFFPLILSRFSKLFTKTTIAMLWIVFLYTYHNYFTDLWNPHPAPLFILLAIYLQFVRPTTFSKKALLVTGLAGLTTGFVMNFQLSFGIGMIFGSTLYLLGERALHIFRHKKNIRFSLVFQSLATLAAFFIGVIVAFTPFLFFELRHHFQQTKVLLTAFTHYGGGLVSQIGLTKPQIIQQFLDKFAEILHLPFLLALAVIIAASVYFLYTYRKSKTKTAEIKLIAIIFCISFGVLYIYLTAKNPVWSYHFIGVEILTLLLIGVLFNHLKYLWLVFVCWIVILSAPTFLQVTKSNQQKIYGTAASEAQTVTKIQNEANGRDYTVFAYEAGIYPYEYSYLFRTMYHQDVPYRPELNPTNAKLVFVILPPHLSASLSTDFINFRTPSAHYVTTNRWTQPDGTEILQRNNIK